MATTTQVALSGTTAKAITDAFGAPSPGYVTIDTTGAGATVFIGGPGVTSATGQPQVVTTQKSYYVRTGDVLYAVLAGAGTPNIQVLS